ncbi:MAG TPA: LysR substrate-binding domain-containing protein [Amaricoccus sp.]|uniref:LysR substrate-binding domain-containing protein n=1 Tax=Amaricoccus sp. TaxID=1872485 RepID=UPI002C1B0FFE|nr:LysR substrate-binding domain-containing protein [Amaricoccus sp.]HMQ94862.1 LysR substrate-binding domain-containing protein [Amaricoccus sp.]HMR54667.1 LysR substrate-binding domain-containing protein [Amaricoccus sp.]HMU01711.1 LysR substrate-binding domain-containing protein [Amaricoccus sp.]
MARLVQSFGLLAAVQHHGSFAAAARALDLDPSAVSHRVRALEAELRMPLFERSTRHVTPTRAGAILCDAATRSFADAGRALAAARDLQSARALRLSVHSSLAMKWLLPRLPAAAASGLDLSIDVREELVVFEGGEVDAGLRFGEGPYPGLHSTRLAGCDLQPVVGAGHPAAQRTGVDRLADESLTLLTDTGAEKFRTGTTWTDYRRLLGSNEVSSNPVKHFDRADLMLQAAIGGLGVALGRTLLIEDDICNGLLIPVGQPVRVAAAYWLVTKPELADTASMMTLRAWLKEQIGLTTGRHARRSLSVRRAD